LGYEGTKETPLQITTNMRMKDMSCFFLMGVGRVAQLVEPVELRVKGGGGPRIKSWQQEKITYNVIY